MTDNYDHETLQAIITEAKRQGFDDKIIALNLGIARDNPAFGYAGEDQTRASISEQLRRGHARENIAQDMKLTLAEIVRIEGNPDLHAGLAGWGTFYVHPDAPHSESGILRLIERGRSSLNAATFGRTVALLGRNPARNESLAMLVDALGLEGAHDLIAAVLRILGNTGTSALALHIPENAVKAVMMGSFPTSEIAPTLQ